MRVVSRQSEQSADREVNDADDERRGNPGLTDGRLDGSSLRIAYGRGKKTANWQCHLSWFRAAVCAGAVGTTNRARQGRLLKDRCGVRLDSVGRARLSQLSESQLRDPFGAPMPTRLERQLR